MQDSVSWLRTSVRREIHWRKIESIGSLDASWHAGRIFVHANVKCSTPLRASDSLDRGDLRKIRLERDPDCTVRYDSSQRTECGACCLADH